MVPSPTTQKTKGYQFGTFQGVFTPNILTILGVIMYLRFGWVLGQVGLPQTLFIVTLSTAITFLTALSISQMATNARMGVGGAYHIISRSLGPQAGAAIGIPLFLAQALSIAFYTAGFAESLGMMFPEYPVRTLGVIALGGITLIAYFSADIALKVQYVIMAAIALSLVSFFLGSPADVPVAADSSFLRLPFWAVFAVFFPAVTGILSGLSLSGDLKDPARSIPRGTIGAVLISYVIYMSIPLFLTGLGLSPSTLIEDAFVMQKVARWDILVMAGLWGATLSSAVGSILGAPRTLQALARDHVVPKFLSRGYGSKNEPHLALFLSALIGLSGILAGSLDSIATLLTMFFLTTYGLLNLSAAVEGMIQNPSW
ncbi:MAG: amino acid permease, partial [Elusimicrobia bacterium]|nr:amino acid permease [Elusimicrobiota bacterium]